ncbi:MAG: hypothetical protein ACJ8CR_14130 [Roseiflexaceae bacterium]
MSEHPTDQQAAHTRPALLIQLQEARTRRLASVTGRLADPVFHATAAPDDVAMLRSHQAALEKIIVLVECLRVRAQTPVDTLKQAHPRSSIPVREIQRFLVWWGKRSEAAMRGNR